MGIRKTQWSTVESAGVQKLFDILYHGRKTFIPLPAAQFVPSIFFLYFFRIHYFSEKVAVIPASGCQKTKKNISDLAAVLISFKMPKTRTQTSTHTHTHSRWVACPKAISLSSQALSDFFSIVQSPSRAVFPLASRPLRPRKPSRHRSNEFKSVPLMAKSSNKRQMGAWLA